MCTQVHSTAFNAHSKAFACTQSTFNHVQLHSMLTQRHSCTLRECSTMFKRVQYSLKGVHVHSSTFYHVHTCSKAFMCTQFCAEISSKVHSVMFRLTQRHSHALKCMQSCSRMFNAHSKILTCTQVCPIGFSCIHSRSSVFNTCSKAFTHTQACSAVVTLTQRQSRQKL